MRQHEDLGDTRPEQFDEDGPLPLECEDCQEEVQGACYRPHRHAVLCDHCEDTRNEAAYERSLESFYGGSSGSVAEQSQQALADKRRQ